METTAAGQDVARKNYEAFARAWDASHSAWLAEADHYESFYYGDQWSDEDIATLDGEGRPYLTINEVLPIVNAVLGEQQSQRVGFRFVPSEEGDEEVARLLTALSDHVQGSNHYPLVESDVFADGLIDDRGFFDVRMNFDKNVYGDIDVRAEDPYTVVIDPDAKEYDPSTWSQVFVTHWYSLDQVEVIYGKEAADKLRAYVTSYGTLGINSVRLANINESRFGDVSTHVMTPEGERYIRAVRVIERQWRTLDRRKYFVDLVTGDKSPVPEDMDTVTLEQINASGEVAVVPYLCQRWRWTVSCDNVLLHDAWSPYDWPTIVPFFPYWRRGRPSGMVRHLVSPQEQLNKVESQVLHVVNTTANSGWIVEENSLANMTPEELQKDGAKTGLVMVVRKGRTAPAKIAPNSVPTGLDHVATKSAGYLAEISGVQALLGRMPKSEVSGVALQESRTLALSGLQVVFTNLARSRELVAKRILDLIQKYYTETRVFRVTNWRSPEEERQEIAINQVDPTTQRVLNDVTVGKYDVIIDTVPARDGAKETEFAEALQLREVGVYIPDDVVIRNSHLTQRIEVAERVKRLQGMGDPTTEEAQMAAAASQLQMQTAMAQLQETLARAEKLRAEAMGTETKAATDAADTQAQIEASKFEQMYQLEKLRADTLETIANLKTKMALADKHIAAKNAQTVYSETSRRVEQARKAVAAKTDRDNRVFSRGGSR